MRVAKNRLKTSFSGIKVESVAAYTGLEISSCPLARHGSNLVGAT